MTDDELLAKLREWDAAATPGPWTSNDTGFVHHTERDGQSWTIGSFGRSARPVEDARLTTLVHEVLPLAEALFSEHRAYVRTYRESWDAHLADAQICNVCLALARLAERMEAQD